MRRGKPCNHIKFGEDIALLAGDGLLTQAFEAVSDFETDDKLNKNRIRSIKILAECAGMSGMISGQCMDLRINADNISVDKVLELYRLKTAKLFCAASEIGALMSGAGQDEADLAKEYGERIGIVFQLVDDILDNEEKLLGAFRKETPNEFLKRLTSEAKEILGKINGNSVFLKELTDYLTCRMR